MKPLKALIVEDSELDEELLLRQLAKANFEVQSIRVQTAAAMEKALAEHEWDIILSDYAMPGFTGLDALRVLKESERDIPLIIISGTIGEDVAVEAMRVGVDDYLMKGKLTRLAPAIERELENAANRQAQKRAEESLRRSDESKHFLASIVESSRDSIISIGFDGIITSWNAAAELLYGYSAAEAVGKPLTMLTLPEDRKEILAKIDAIKHSRQVEIFETERIGKDGRHLFLEIKMSPIKNDGGEVIGISTFARDITERRQAAEALRLSEASLANAQRIAHVGNWDWDIQNDQVLWSEEIYRIFGLARSDFERTYKSFFEFVHPDDRQKVQAAVDATLTENAAHNYEHRIIRPDGEERIVHQIGEVRFDEMGKPLRFIGTVQDVTERNLSERLQRESEQRLSFALDAADIGDWDMDLRTNVARRSLRHDQCFGYSEAVSEWSYETFLAHVHPADHDRVDAAFQQAMSDHLGDYDVEFRTIWRDGSLHWLWSKGRFYFDESAQPYRVAGIQVDITERKRAAAALENAAKRERAMIENSLDVICTIDAEGKFASVSPASFKDWGYQPEELVGREYIELVVPEDVAKTSEAAAEIMSGAVVVDFENCHRHKNGSKVHLRWTAKWSETDRLIFCVAHNFTERKAAEDKMRLMKSAVDSIVEGIIISDAQKPDNPIIYTNHALENLTGYTFDEVRGRNCRFLQGAETNPQTVGEIREALETESKFHGEILNYRKNGESFWNELSISPVFDSSGVVTHYVGIQQDISERKQAEEILRASEAKIRQLVDSSIIGITTTRLDGAVIEANDVFLKMVGYSRQDLMAGKIRWDEMTPPEIFWQDERAKEQLFELGYSIPREKEYIRKDGSRVPVMVGGTLLKDTEDTVLAFVLDISEQKRVEEEKRLLNIQIEQQHERLNNVIANVPGVVWEAYGLPDAPTQRIDFVSEYVETMLGYTVEEWLATPNFWLSIVHPEDKARIAHEATERFVTGDGYTRQFRWIAKDGHIVWVESQATVIRDKSGQPIGLRGINVDITERKRLEEERTELIAELDTEKRRLQHIFDNSPSFILSLRGPDFVFEMANPAYYQLVGQRNLIGVPAREALPEVMAQGLSEITRRVYQTGEPFIGNEVPVNLQLAGRFGNEAALSKFRLYAAAGS